MVWGGAIAQVAPSYPTDEGLTMTINNKTGDKYELTLASFPKAVVYEPAGNIMAVPTPSGEPAVLAFLSVDQASAFIGGLASSGKVSEPCRVVSVGVRDWIPFAESLISAGVKHVAVAQEVGVKMAVVPLADLLEAAKEFASGVSESQQGGGTGGHEGG